VKKSHPLNLTKHDILLIILNILMILTLIIVYKFLKKTPLNKIEEIEGKFFNNTTKLFSLFFSAIEILLIKRGNIFGGPGGEDMYDDAGIATLTFNDTITRVTAAKAIDLTSLFLDKSIAKNIFEQF
jgi:hypothetical protein